MPNSGFFESTADTSILVLLENQQSVLAQAASGMPLAAVLQYLAHTVERQFSSGALTSILLLDEQGRHLRHGAVGSLPPAYAKAIDGIAIGPAAGSCGTAVFRGEAVFVADIATDPLWTDYRDAALSQGLKACWSTPIRSINGKLLGALAVYYPDVKAPAPADRDILAFAAHTAALAIERTRSDQALKSTEARYRQMFNSATDFAIISSGLDGLITSWNTGAQHILGWSEQEMIGQTASRFFTPEDAANGRPEAEMQCALKEGYASDERWHVRKSGERFFAAGAMTPLKNEAGAVIGFVKIMRDRTGHKQDEEKLHALTATLEQEVALRTRERDRIWRNSMDLLLVIDPGGTVRAVNPAWTSSLGYAPDELENHYFEPFVHPDDVAPTIAAITHAAQNPLEHFEVRLRHKNGSYRWFAWRAAPEGGMVYANGRDITVEKKQAEQLLLANEARLQLALEAGEMGVWEWNPQTNIILWLHGMAALHGVAAIDEPFSISMADYMRQYVHPDDRASLTETMAHVARQTDNHRGEYRIVRPDGNVLWIEVRGQMFTDEAGVPSQMVGVITNITRRKRIEQDLQFLAGASAALAGLVDAQSTLDRLAYLAVPSFADWCAVDLLQEDGTLKRVAVAHVDPGKVQLAHELHRRFPPDPALPHGVWKIIQTRQSEMVSEITEEMLAQAIDDPDYLTIMKALGLRSYIGVPLSAHGKVLGAVTFIAAESHRRYGPDDLVLAEDLARRTAVAIENADLYRVLRESDKAKDVFLATLAHELRNPLAAIVSGLNLMTLTIDDKNRMRQYIGLLERQTGQLTRLVDDLMDISRISTGKIQLKKEHASLAAILNSAIETSRPHIEAAQHTLSVDLPSQPTDISADPVRLAQVFSNLLTNAAKYTNRGGAIHVALECTPAEYIVRVRDTGIGIAPDMLKSIFKIFTQVTHPIQRSQGGLGIGLSLVDGLVKMHGGSVEAISAGPGQGSEFVVHLPRAVEPDDDGKAASHAASDALPEKPRGRRILVVDDNVDAASTMAELLGTLGHQVTMVHDGLTAVATAAQMQPEVIVLDIGLPGIDGYEVARRIRAQAASAGKAPVLIALTGWGLEQDKQRAYQAGFDHHWVKPIGIEQVKELAGF